MEFNDFFRVIDNYYGYRAKDYCLYEDKKEIECVLYESLLVTFSIGDRYGVFGAAINLDGERHSIVELLGKKISLNSDETSIKNSLDIIDEYCRLRLPDKFLEAYDKAYK